VEVRAPARRHVGVCYYMQTHKQPLQIARLVRLLKEGSPDCVVLIHHDDFRAPLDPALFASLSDVYVINGPGGYGDFSHLRRYFDAIDWLDDQGIEYDWLHNMTGQDYPLRPVSEIEQFLAGSACDGYLQYAPVFPEEAPPDVDWGAGPGYRLGSKFDVDLRLNYAHRRIGRPTAGKQRWLRPVMALNLIQPWVRVSTSYSTVAVRRKASIFSDDFICYGGSFFNVLSAACVRYVRDFVRDNPEVVQYFHVMPAPNEVFLQTVLVNSGKFRLVPDGTYYIDWTNSRYNHPKILGNEDLAAMLASGANWARKFEAETEVLDLLDRHIGRAKVTTLYRGRRVAGSATEGLGAGRGLTMCQLVPRPMRSNRDERCHTRLLPVAEGLLFFVRRPRVARGVRVCRCR
jgi:hypothetical protein